MDPSLSPLESIVEADSDSEECLVDEDDDLHDDLHEDQPVLSQNNKFTLVRDSCAADDSPGAKLTPERRGVGGTSGGSTSSPSVRKRTVPVEQNLSSTL